MHGVGIRCGSMRTETLTWLQPGESEYFETATLTKSTPFPEFQMEKKKERKKSKNFC